MLNISRTLKWFRKRVQENAVTSRAQAQGPAQGGVVPTKDQGRCCGACGGQNRKTQEVKS